MLDLKKPWRAPVKRLQVDQVTPQTCQHCINQTGTGLSCTVGMFCCCMNGSNLVSRMLQFYKQSLIYTFIEMLIGGTSECLWLCLGKSWKISTDCTCTAFLGNLFWWCATALVKNLFPHVHPEPRNSQSLPLVILFGPTEKYFVPIATTHQVVVWISWNCCSFLGMKIIQCEQWAFLFPFFFFSAS